MFDKTQSGHKRLIIPLVEELHEKVHILALLKGYASTAEMIRHMVITAVCENNDVTRIYQERKYARMMEKIKKEKGK
jgi:hypothetical protein